MKQIIISILDKILQPLLSPILQLLPDSILLKMSQNIIISRLYPPRRKVIYGNFAGKYIIEVDTSYMIDRTMLKGWYDSYSTAVINKLIKDKFICFDIGANVGAIALTIEAVSNGKIYAFEPGPHFKRLQRNIELNNLQDKVICVDKALGETPGELRWSGDDTGNGMLSLSGNIAVEITTLDIFCTENNINKIDFVKIDVEGMELSVLKGGIETIKKTKPIIYYESLNKTTNAVLVDELLINAGYKLYELHNNKLYEIPINSTTENIIAIHTDNYLDLDKF